MGQCASTAPPGQDLQGVAPPLKAPPANSLHLEQPSASSSTRDTAAVRRPAVTAGKDHLVDFKKTTVAKPEETTVFLTKSMAMHPMFSQLDDLLRRELADQMSCVDVTEGTDVVVEGAEGDMLYVVETGVFQAYESKAPGEVRNTFTTGSIFGEVALLYNTPRIATVRCSKSGRVWALNRNAFRATVTKSSTLDNDEFLKAVDVLANLNDRQISALSRCMVLKTFQDGEYIVRKGELADAIYFIKSGEVVVHQKDPDNALDAHGEMLRLTEGQFFGETAINNTDDADPRRSDASVSEEVKRTANVVAVGRVILLRLAARDFHALIGDLSESLARNFALKVINSIPLFASLTETQKEDFAARLETVTFQRDGLILEEGKEADTFYIVRSGEVQVFQRGRGGGPERELARIGPSAYLGERALLTHESISASARVTTSSAVLYAMSYSAFTASIGSLQAIIDGIAAEVRRKDELNKQSGMNLAQLEQIRTLGVGTFGRVKIVRDREAGTAYALKVLDKRQVVHMKQEEHVMQEKTLLAQCRHPFIIELVATFQDDDSLYMLMELCPGGELFSRLQATGPMHNDDARFYAACVVSAFSYMHKRRIAYRDLKPENLILDAQGFAKLVDFGFAKQVLDRTLTLCGTPEYLAPEIILNKSHDIGVDWWTTGILIYELLSGRPPFTDPDPMGLYEQILRGKVRYPSKFTKEARSLMSKLIEVNPAVRIGASTNGQEVKDHPWFADFDWEALEKRTMPPPWAPPISDPFDDRHFDKYDEAAAEKKKKQFKDVELPPDAFRDF